MRRSLIIIARVHIGHAGHAIALEGRIAHRRDGARRLHQRLGDAQRGVVGPHFNQMHLVARDHDRLDVIIRPCGHKPAKEQDR